MVKLALRLGPIGDQSICVGQSHRPSKNYIVVLSNYQYLKTLKPDLTISPRCGLTWTRLKRFRGSRVVARETFMD